MQEKRKRTPAVSQQAPRMLHLARAFMVMSVIYTLLIAFQVDALYDVYATISGVTMTFFWPLVCTIAGLGLLWNEYRTHSQPLRARAVTLMITALLIVTAGMFTMMMTGFH